MYLMTQFILSAKDSISSAKERVDWIRIMILLLPSKMLILALKAILNCAFFAFNPFVFEDNYVVP